MLRMGLAPTAMLKCSPEFFRSTAALARRHPGEGFRVEGLVLRVQWLGIGVPGDQSSDPSCCV